MQDYLEAAPFVYAVVTIGVAMAFAGEKLMGMRPLAAAMAGGFIQTFGFSLCFAHVYFVVLAVRELFV